uniref:ATP-grasp domain-containing protein n=1 Tax=Cyanothece sp. (strain PCC 7425 / ATCC 29141) TaxID=395961 RepID=B8HK07_CYAP4
MSPQPNFPFFQGHSLSDLFAQDCLTQTQANEYALILNYPATAHWAAYPNTQKYLLQDGSSEATKTSFDKICQKEPWKNLAVLGDQLTGVVIMPPHKLLINYWRDTFGFRYANLANLDCAVYLDQINRSDRFRQIITLFPFDHLKPEKHAIDPDIHYRLLSKAALSELGVNCPRYQSYDLDRVRLEQIQFPQQFPYLVKTSHGLSGEGTYILRRPADLEYCLAELNKYRQIHLLQTIIISEFVQHEVQNYCVQFYVNKQGDITLIGVTQQLVDSAGNYLGGWTDYSDDLSQFTDLIATIGRYAHQQGFFGVIGCDILEDREGQLYAIDANFRINGSTPLCLQRHRLLKLGKVVAKYSSDYRMEGSLDAVLVTLKPELDRQDFLILSALEKAKFGKIYTEIYGIVTGESISELQQIEQKLYQKGLRLVG